MNEAADQRGLKGFLNKGGFWRLVPVVIVYIAIYLLAGKVIVWLTGDWGRGDLLDSLSTVFVQLTFGLLVGAVVLALFTRWMGWNGELYGRQRIYRSWWMWLGPIIALIPIVMRAAGIDWGGRPLTISAFVLFSGLFVGFVEEMLCRGIAVKMLRDAGHGEFVVAALSSLTFALLHATNLLSGQALRTTLIQMFYTFGFGVLMYLTLRSTRFLVFAMLVHGLTDPMGALANGGIGDDATATSLNPLLNAAGLLTIPIGLAGLILLLFVRGKYGQTTKGHHGSDEAAPAAGV
jgi:membrane protease YdiL (CAAX protease family)